MKRRRLSWMDILLIECSIGGTKCSHVADTGHEWLSFFLDKLLILIFAIQRRQQKALFSISILISHCSVLDHGWAWPKELKTLRRQQVIKYVFLFHSVFIPDSLWTPSSMKWIPFKRIEQIMVYHLDAGLFQFLFSLLWSMLSHNWIRLLFIMLRTAERETRIHRWTFHTSLLVLIWNTVNVLFTQCDGTRPT